MTPLPSTTSGTEEGRAFLQRRVAAFGLFVAALVGAAALLRAIPVAIAGHWSEYWRPSFLSLLGVGAVFLVVWLKLRCGRPSALRIRALEALAMILSAGFAVQIGRNLPFEMRPELHVVFVLALLLVLRAIYVPSTARRTVTLGALMAIPLIASTYLIFAGAERSDFPSMPERMREVSMQQIAVIATGFTMVYWLAAIVIAAAGARVIYGLRREAREARSLGQYTLVKRLGRGGMGEVWLARHAMLRRPTAIKLLLPEHVGEASLRRFEREVQLTAQLTHPNTVTIYDFGRTPDGTFYYVMELLDGGTLEEIVALDGAQPAERVVHVLEQAAGALAEAHGVGLIHRDIKPANLMLCARGGQHDVAKVFDFGLVKQLDSEVSRSLSSAEDIAGTPLYMAPEAITSPGAVDDRTDLYALGAVGYFLLTGQHVFEGKSVVEVCAAHLRDPPVPPSQRLGAPVPADLERLLLRCLEKDPTARPQSAAELQAALRRLDVEAWDGAWWWEEYGHALGDGGRAGAEESAEGRSIAVDLHRRRALPDPTVTVDPPGHGG